MDGQPLLRMQGIRKTFAGIAALAGIDFTLERGQVHALVGENGAGKSTLIKVLTGAYQRDGGTVLLEGRPVQFRSPREAQAQGVVAVYQEVNLLEGRTVAENILLGREPTRWGLIDWPRLYSDAAEVLARLGLNVDVKAPLSSLNIAVRQLVAIARGVSLGAKVVVLDEPTSSLSCGEVELLYDVICRLQASGVGVIYISHRFDELYAVCDQVTVLRDGHLIATRPLAGLNRLELVCLMLGKRCEEVGQGTTELHRPETVDGGLPLLQADGLQGGAVRGVSLEVHVGEIVGLAGLLGSGRTETARLLFGLDAASGGEIRFQGAVLKLRSPRDAIAAGLGFLAEDRKAEGIFPDLSVRENLTLAALPELSRCGIVSRSQQRAVVDRFMARLHIKGEASQKIRELSGGNQQKVLLARWLCRHPRFLILDDPTRGVDVGARGEIQALVGEMARAGLAVLLISSELQELVEGCGRVVVLRDGRSVAELVGDRVEERSIMRAMAGDNDEHGHG